MSLLFYSEAEDMKSTSSFIIHGWMCNELGLKGNDLLVYALIYSFSQDDVSSFADGRKYIADTFNISLPTVDKALQNLLDMGYIQKHSSNDFINTDIYWADMGVVKKLYEGSKETLLDLSISNKNISNTNKQTNKNTSTKANKDKEKAIEYIYELYKMICTDLPKIRVLSAGRRKAIAVLLKHYSVEDIETCFTKANESDFLLGKVTNWRADFDWLMQEDKFIRVLEGRYDNTKPKSQTKNKAWEKNVKCEKYTAEEEAENEKWQKDMLKKGVRIDY